MTTRKYCTALVFVALAIVSDGRAKAQQFPSDGNLRRPFIATLSNLTPLAFGMNLDETSHALGQPLRQVSGRPGSEIYLALRNLGASGLIYHQDRLYLQFRGGRLTGWKEDYGQNWMWR
jgi:hypothetical protein